MGPFVRFYNALTRRRTFDPHEFDQSELARVLTLLDLTTLCVGSTLGLGVYVLAGLVAYNVAGPGVTISFLIAGIASTFSGLCYAELAASVPRAGSAYVYSYVMIGEFTGFTIGWNLVLEYMIGTAGVARGLSGYVDELTGNKISKTLLENFPINMEFLGSYPDFLSFGMVALLTMLLGWDVKLSSITNILFTTINLCTICTVIISGSFHANPENWALPADKIPKGFGVGGFMPFGIAGIFTGAAKCFFGFVGFDCIATTGEEALNPKRNIPLAIGISLTIIFLTYFSISVVLTMAVPYYALDPNSPLSHIFDDVGWYTVKWIVTVGALFALSTSLLGAMFPLPRIIYAMAHDRVIYFCLSKINDFTRTPLIATIVSGLLTGTMALIFDLDHLIGMMSLGTLTAYSIVAVCIIVLRYEDDQANTVPLSCTAFFKQLCNCGHAKVPNSISSAIALTCIGIYSIGCAIWCSFANVYQLTENLNVALTDSQLTILGSLGVLLLLCILVISRQPMSEPEIFFQVPLVPYIPCMSIFINLYLMFQLDLMTWLRFVCWLLIGYIIYFTYGIWHSNQFERDERNSRGSIS